MKIINRYYNKSGRLVKKRTKEDSALIRFKILKNGEKYPCCDFKGKCANFAYVEAFPIGKHVWHYSQ